MSAHLLVVYKGLSLFADQAFTCHACVCSCRHCKTLTTYSLCTGPAQVQARTLEWQQDKAGKSRLCSKRSSETQSATIEGWTHALASGAISLCRNPQVLEPGCRVNQHNPTSVANQLGHQCREDWHGDLSAGTSEQHSGHQCHFWTRGNGSWQEWLGCEL